MTDTWTPAQAAAFVAANNLDAAFNARYPNAAGSVHEADWKAIWLNANAVESPDATGPGIDYSGAVQEEQAISTSPDYVPRVVAASANFGPILSLEGTAPDSDISAALGLTTATITSTSGATGIGSGQPQPIGVVTPASGSTFTGGTGPQSLSVLPAAVDTRVAIPVLNLSPVATENRIYEDKDDDGTIRRWLVEPDGTMHRIGGVTAPANSGSAFTPPGEKQMLGGGLPALPDGAVAIPVLNLSSVVPYSAPEAPAITNGVILTLAGGPAAGSTGAGVNGTTVNPAAPTAAPADAGGLLRLGLTVAGYFLFR